MKIVYVAIPKSRQARLDLADAIEDKITSAALKGQLADILYDLRAAILKTPELERISALLNDKEAQEVRDQTRRFALTWTEPLRSIAEEIYQGTRF